MSYAKENDATKLKYFLLFQITTFEINLYLHPAKKT